MEDKKTEITRKSALEIIKGQVANYQVADRITRGMILDALESSLKRPRKSLIRTLPLH